MKATQRAIINGHWAIERQWLNQIIAIATRQNKAVENDNAENLNYERTVSVREGVAIIPIAGPIFRYANLFTHYSGGTSISELTKDFNRAINNPNVNSILFEINSPGGEVTGVNELAQTIFEGRARKPIAARIGGLGCSAAYWLATACSDIIIDETAVLGSIGVMAVYLDHSKMDEMRGLKEIKIISSQSPYKNPDPTLDEGKLKIQAQIDALAQVFIETVARNRGVQVKTVLEKFGQGDCFVGQTAIDAGLADRLGSFENTLAELVENTNSQTEFTNIKTTKMYGANDFRNRHLHLNGREKIVKSAEKENQSKAQENNNDAKASEFEFEKLKAELAAERKRADDQEAQLKIQLEENVKLTNEARKNRLTIKAENFAGDKLRKISFMEALASAFGESSQELDFYITDQNTLAEQIRTGQLFSEVGRGGSDTNSDGDALAQLEAKAKVIALEKNISFEQALVKASEQNPELYRRYASGQ